MTEGEFIHELLRRGFYPLGGYSNHAAREFGHYRLNMLVDLLDLARAHRPRAIPRRLEPYRSALSGLDKEIAKLSAIDQLAILGDTVASEVEQGLEEHDL